MQQHCNVDDCDNKVKTKGMCNMHYLRVWVSAQSLKDPNKRTCTTCSKELDLDNFYIANIKTGRRERRCKNCRKASQITQRRRDYICKYRKSRVEDHTFGTCLNCKGPLGRYERVNGQKRKTEYCYKCHSGERHQSWTGGKSHNSDGYVTVRVGVKEIRLEHRVVMEKHIGRKLYEDETVHHKNGVRTDNRIDNLEIWVGAPIRGIRPKDAVAWAEEIIKRYK